MSSIQSISFSSYPREVRRYNNYKYYENPVNRSTERNLAVLSSVGISVLTAGIIGALTTCFNFCKGNRAIPVGVGLAAGVLSLLFTLPQNLYKTKVNAFAREKEMDVFSRQKDAQANIYGDINDEIQDDDVSLDQKISHYSTVRMADNGGGLMVKGI